MWLKLCLSIYENFSLSRENSIQCELSYQPSKKYPDCIKITPIGRRDTSNFAINLFFKSENSYTAKIDTINKNSSSHPDDDYINV